MIGHTLGHHRILEKIGSGGMGEVYRARDERLERAVAIKVLPAGTLTDQAAGTRFRIEALALARLSHPNVGVVYDLDTQDGTDFLVNEYIGGTTLASQLTKGALPEKEAVKLGQQEPIRLLRYAAFISQREATALPASTTFLAFRSTL